MSTECQPPAGGQWLGEEACSLAALQRRPAHLLFWSCHSTCTEAAVQCDMWTNPFTSAAGPPCPALPACTRPCSYELLAKLRGTTGRDSEDAKAPLKAIRNAVDQAAFNT